MPYLNRTTLQRLCKLPQSKDVWEGDRRPLPPAFQSQMSDMDAKDVEWILWVDQDRMIRAMDIIPTQSGPEVFVRTLLKAMEFPQGPVGPGRPSTLFVRDRELQFFLRGALQDLDIEVNFAPALPLIEEIVEGMAMMVGPSSPELSESLENALEVAIDQIWETAPWDQLGDHQILQLDISATPEEGDPYTESLYVSLLGNLGVEFGIILYRSLDSLRQFRAEAVNPYHSSEEMEAIFLRQDCLFLNFDTDDDEDEAPFLQALLPDTDAQTVSSYVGSIHPLEGMRPFLEAEDTITMIAALRAIHSFYQKHKRKFRKTQFPKLVGSYQYEFPEDLVPQVEVAIKTCPDLAQELLAMGEEDGHDDGEDEWVNALLDMPDDIPMRLGMGKVGPRGKTGLIRDDLIPANTMVSLGMLPWQIMQYMEHAGLCFQEGDERQEGDGFPVVMVQTSRPKAKEMVERLTLAEIQGIGFALGLTPDQEPSIELGIIAAKNRDIYLFYEYDLHDPVHQSAREAWDLRTEATKGWCGLVIARGITGQSRGNPKLPDLVGMFKAKVLLPSDFQPFVSVQKL